MKPNGRSMEIQRLIGRALRAVVDLEALGEKTITLDCDAIRADGGTRCAAITAAYVATFDALEYMKRQKMLKKDVLKDQISAISVGVYRGTEVLDLNYDEDSVADTDMNVVMTGSGKFVEVQGTAESEPFDAATLGHMLKLAKKGCDELFEAQRQVLGL
jgi:ribonuclease PH